MTTPPESPAPRPQKGSFGPNAWLVDDLYDRFLEDPDSVAASWREFFVDYQRSPVPVVSASHVVAPTSATPAARVVINEEATPLRGA
nr:hypothetical protein [Acidobacteriota bacterium]